MMTKKRMDTLINLSGEREGYITENWTVENLSHFSFSVFFPSPPREAEGGTNATCAGTKRMATCCRPVIPIPHRAAPLPSPLAPSQLVHRRTP